MRTDQDPFVAHRNWFFHAYDYEEVPRCKNKNLAPPGWGQNAFTRLVGHVEDRDRQSIGVGPRNLRIFPMDKELSEVVIAAGIMRLPGESDEQRARQIHSAASLARIWGKKGIEQGRVGGGRLCEGWI